MRTILTLFAVIVIIASCKKKDKPIPPAPVDNTDSTDSTNVPKLKDSTLKIVGIDSIVTIGFYDSIEIPITIMRDTGTAQIVTLSISGLCYRVRAKFTNNTGTTPLTTTLKLYTYLVGGMDIQDSLMTITATANNGQQWKRSFKLKLEYSEDLYKAFYEAFLKSLGWAVYSTDLNKLVTYGPAFYHDPGSKRLCIKGLYVGKLNGKNYYAIDTIYTNGGSTGWAEFLFEPTTVRCSSGSDTVSESFWPYYLNYYRNYGTDSTEPKIEMPYRGIDGEYYSVRGKLHIEGF